MALRFILLFACFGVGFPFFGQARETVTGPISADVLQVRDGDTLRVRAHVWPGHDVQIAVRIRGIDAPELRARCKIEKRLAEQARDMLKKLVGGSSVQLYDVSGGKYFGRVLASVRTASGQDIEAEMLRLGLVKPYRGRRRANWCDPARLSLTFCLFSPK